jgi:hypothetical protein
MRIDIRPVPSDQLSGLKAVSGPLMIGLSWNMPPISPTYAGAQVFVNTVNDFETATLYATIANNAFDYPSKDAATVYFWIRAVDAYGRATGPVSGPASAKGALINTESIGVFDLATANIINQLKVANITGLGALATLNRVNASTQVTNLGGLAFANQIAANDIGAGTIAAGVIYSGSISANQITAGTLNAININAGAGAFSVSGSTGRAVGNNMLVYGLQTDDLSGINGNGACYAFSRRAGNPGIYAMAQNGHAVTGYSYSNFAFYAQGGGYGPFTGTHDVVWPAEKETIGEEGDIAVDVQCVARSSISNTLFEVELSSKPNQKGAIGILVGKGILMNDQSVPAAFTEGMEDCADDEGREWKQAKATPEYEAIKDKYLFGAINAVGEGQVNVCGENGDIERGDLIVTSSMPGKGMRQSDDFVRSYTVARAREDVSFSTPGEVKQVACIYLCG